MFLVPRRRGAGLLLLAEPDGPGSGLLLILGPDLTQGGLRDLGPGEPRPLLRFLLDREDWGSGLSPILVDFNLKQLYVQYKVINNHV